MHLGKSGIGDVIITGIMDFKIYFHTFLMKGQISLLTYEPVCDIIVTIRTGLYKRDILLICRR